MIRMDEGPDLTVIVASGAPRPSELLETYQRFLDAGCPDSLWDFSAATTRAIPSTRIHDLVEAFAAAGRGRQPTGRSAIVCVHDADFGLARMFEVLLSERELPVETRVFHGLDEAKAWLAAGRKERRRVRGRERQRASPAVTASRP